MTDPVETFCSLLLSEEPAAAIPEGQRLFEPLIGSWDLRVRWFDETGAVSRETSGEWHFVRVLDGRGLQDVWIVPGAEERQRGRDAEEYGTSIRFYDPAIDAWRSTWIGPRRGVVVLFIGRPSEDGISLETTDDAAVPMRWSFHDIGADSFRWQSRMGGPQAWRLVQEFAATRRR